MEQDKMTVERIKDILSQRYEKKGRGSWEDYKNGKTFISLHVRNSQEYDECVKHLVDILKL